MEIILAPNTLEDAERYAGKLSMCKVGLPLITEMGVDAVFRVGAMGYRQILYDAKFYDIPSVVVKAIERIPLNTWGITIHVSEDNVLMLRAARKTADETGLKVFGVLKLTSEPVNQKTVERRLRVCKGFVDGVVCAVAEASYVKEQAPHLLTLCPGVVSTVSHMNDQRRVSTPQQAAKSGVVDYVIIGRMLTTEPDPDRALAVLARSLEE